MISIQFLGQVPAADEVVPGFGEQMMLFFQEGGFFMILLGLCSLAGLAAILFKALSLSRGRIVPTALAKEVGTGASVSVLEPKFRQGGSTLARLGQVAMAHSGRSPAKITESVQAAAREEIVRMQAGMTVLDVVVTVAPLLGLLGTASGLVVVFSGLESEADRVTIALGIGRALKTTIVGLAIAVPAIIAQGFFQRRIETFAARLEVLLTGVVDRVGGERDEA